MASWPDDARMFAILEKYCHFPTYGVNVSMKKQGHEADLIDVEVVGQQHFN